MANIKKIQLPNGEIYDIYDAGAARTTDLNGLATETYVDNKVASLVNSAPETLDTLNELSAALGNDPNFATTVATQIGSKVDKVDGKGLSANDYTTAEKTKLAGIETGATKTTIDSVLSTTSTNPVQNKIITTQINNLNTLVGDTAVSTQITNAIANIQNRYIVAFSRNDSDVLVCDKTFTDIVAAIDAGKYVYATYLDNIYQLGFKINSTVEFTRPSQEDNIIEIFSNNSCQIATQSLVGLYNTTGTSITAPMTQAAVTNALDNKVDKVDGKGLSTNDYTTDEKTKLLGIETGANKTTVDTALSTTSTNPVQNKAVKTALDNKLDKSGGTMTGDLTINASKQIIFSKGTGGGTSVYEESTNNSNPKLSFYGVNGDERVTLNNIETPVNDYEATNKKYVDDAIASATSSSDELLLDLVDTPFDSFGLDGFYDYVTLDEPLTLETGILYRVTFGGNSYIDTAYIYSNDIYLGNAQIYNDGAVNGAQPYFIHKAGSSYDIIVYTGSTGGSDTVTIKIEKLGNNYANVDSIIEQGTSGIWTYRKYASGIAECWGSKNYTGTVSTSWGSMYVLTCTPPAYPITFTEKPVVTRDLTQNTGTSCWLTGWSAGSTTSMGTFAIIRPTTGSVDVNVNFHVIGKWK